MSPQASAQRILEDLLARSGESRLPVPLRAAGSRPGLQEEEGTATLPPAGASRAETLFSVVGIALMTVLAVSFLWVLFRGRR